MIYVFTDETALGILNDIVRLIYYADSIYDLFLHFEHYVVIREKRK